MFDENDQEVLQVLGDIIKKLNGENVTPTLRSFYSNRGKYSIDKYNSLLLFTFTGQSPKIVVPPAERYAVMEIFHNTPLSGHLGISNTFRNIRGKFFWEGRNHKIFRNCVGKFPKNRKLRGWEFTKN